MNAPAAQGEVIRRHSVTVRITHWISALCLLFLLMSGLQIFNAHPALYWGPKGADTDAPWMRIGAGMRSDGQLRGLVKIGERRIDTTGLLGVTYKNGAPSVQAWPQWATIPTWRDLATGRRWHFFFAWLFVLNGAVYLGHGFATRHVQRDLTPDRRQWRGIGRSVLDHIRLRHPRGEEAKRYNVLQKLSYLVVALVLLPAMVVTGLTMSPGFNAAAPWLLDLLGGRQSARSLHFVCAALIVLFTVVHLVEVVLAGPLNEVGSMITGRYRVPPERAPAAPREAAP